MLPGSAGVTGAVTDVRRQTADTYDRIVRDYDARTAQPAPEYVAFRNAFCDRLAAGSRVVDLGCGPGRDAVAFQQRGLEVLGLDASTGMVRRTRERGVPAVVGDHRRPPFADAMAGGVWSSASLLHVPRDDVDPTLRSWRRLLVRGGVLGLSTSLGSSEGWEDAPYAADEPQPAQLRRWFVHHERQSLLDLIAATGFAVIRVDERTSHRRWLQVLAVAG